ncbi:MAG TPA: phage head closure protein [Burkholderiales bacterium]|nr:phage head closure protein [Burkholderiales bacterium]
MRAGSLRKRITIESPTETQNSVGETTQTWSTFAVLWADMERLTGSEKIAAAQVNAGADTRITARWTAGVTEKMRIRYGSRMFQIVSALNVDERNQELDILAAEAL